MLHRPLPPHPPVVDSFLQSLVGLVDSFFDFAHHSLFFLFLSLYCALYDHPMILPFSLALNFNFEFLALAFKGYFFLILLLVTEAADDIGLSHQLLHFEGKVLLSGVLQPIEFLYYFLRNISDTL